MYILLRYILSKKKKTGQYNGDANWLDDNGGITGTWRLYTHDRRTGEDRGYPAGWKMRPLHFFK